MQRRAAAVCRRQVVVKHLAAKLAGCDSALIDDLDYVLDALDRVTEAINMTYLGRVVHRFDPHGLSAVYLLAESHISVHTWPECGLVDLEIVSCSASSDLEKGLRMIAAALGAESTACRKWTFKHDY